MAPRVVCRDRDRVRLWRNSLRHNTRRSERRQGTSEGLCVLPTYPLRVRAPSGRSPEGALCRLSQQKGRGATSEQLTPGRVYNIALQICQGMVYLHKQKVGCPVASACVQVTEAPGDHFSSAPLLGDSQRLEVIERAGLQRLDYPDCRLWN
eukprot:scaffold323_cov414-Prasinococcus_capsulatus_cf.AAC.32